MLFVFFVPLPKKVNKSLVTPSLAMLKKILGILPRKLLTPHVLAAIVTISIANAMGWVDTGEIIEKFERFLEHKIAVAGVFIA